MNLNHFSSALVSSTLLPVGAPAWAVVIIAVLLLIVLAWVFRYRVFLWFPLWFISRVFYKITLHGLENVPKTGPALLVSNHLSHIDGILIHAYISRQVRVLIWADFLRVFYLYPFLRLANAIPIRSTGGPRAIVKALNEAGETLAKGGLVGIFAEGGISRKGFLMPFHRGLAQIVKKHPAPIIPVCIDNIWDSIFSFRGGRFFWKLPRRFPCPLSVTYGKPLPADTPVQKVREAVQILAAESSIRRADKRLPVHRRFVREACRRPLSPCFIDPTNEQKPVMKYGEVLAGVKILAGHLREALKDEEMVGVWIPPSPGGAIVNIALAVLGKTAVNLNYSVSAAGVQSAIGQCKIRKVLTSRLFTRKIALDPGPGVDVIYLDDLRKKISKWDRIRAFLSVLLTPCFVQEYWFLGLGKHAAGDLATVIFSSGSTGEAKGVMLTHGNIAANAEAVIQAFDPHKNDRLLGILPFFHSFGYTVCLWMPLQVGASTVFFPNPLAAKEIGEACKKFQATLFVSSPTFLRSYLKRCLPDDFRSLHLLMCGAEKLPQSLAEEFKEKFGILPLEGYGSTELSPAVAVNVPNFEVEGYKQIYSKPGTIGRPIPGVAAQIVDPETMEQKPIGEEGMLLIYGANIMKGYLNRDDLTAQKMHEGWYITGDLGKIDEEGFITITGRVERFAKVGGEMVPLERIEDEIHQILETNERMCCVTAVPDDKKGERLIVLHMSLNGKSKEELRQELAGRGLPNIYIPGLRDFVQVDDLPVLGSGKLDIKKCKETALAMAGNG